MQPGGALSDGLGTIDESSSNTGDYPGKEWIERDSSERNLSDLLLLEKEIIPRKSLCDAVTIPRTP
jgi:hypothetical protein